jgi:hypothetical protein
MKFSHYLTIWVWAVSLASAGFGQAATPAGPAAPTTMPAGHPALGGASPMRGDAARPAHVGGMASATVGALRVNFSQGTKDGPAIGRDPVTVQLLSKGKVIKSYKTAVNEKGQIEIRDIPLDVAFQPVITIEHAGAQQQRVGPAMHKFQPMVELDMTVYENTAEKPDWLIGIRSVSAEIVDLGAIGLGMQFVDTLECINPADRAWTGEIAASSTPGESRIMTIPLPANARDVQFGPGMAEAGAKVVNNAAVRGKSMLPGPARYVLGYTVASQSGGKLTVTFTAPADNGLFALYVPGDVNIDSAEGLDIGLAGGTNGQQNRRLLKARSVKAGQTLTVTLSNLKLVPKEEPLPQTTDLNLPRPANPETKP